MGDRISLGPEMLLEMEEQVKLSKKRVVEANNWLKSYVNAKRTPRHFVVGDSVLLRFQHQKSAIKYE